MAWTPPTTPVPTTLQRLTITLSDRLATDEADASQTANYQLVILDQDGQRYKWSGDTGDLVLHITPTQRTQLMAFMDALRTQAEAQILGE